MAAGFAVGLFTVASFYHRGPDPQRIALLERSLDVYRDGVTRLIQQATKASLFSTRNPETLLDAVRTFAKAAGELQASAKQPGAAPQTRLSPLRPMALGAVPAMSQGEISRALASTSSGDDELRVESDHCSDSQRYPYRCLQWMGRCGGGERLPAAEDFEQVMCLDLSRNGVSFFADDVQIGSLVVIGIGSGDDLMYAIAEVMHRRVERVDGRLTYLVGCRFVRRLTPHADGELIASYSSRLGCSSMEPVAV
jgi:hypothetical protein